MKKNKAKILIGCGIFCVLHILVSSWYAVKFNDSRLVVPMDFNSYTFQNKGLAKNSFFFPYLYLCFYSVYNAYCKYRKKSTADRKNKYHPQTQSEIRIFRAVRFFGARWILDIFH